MDTPDPKPCPNIASTKQRTTVYIVSLRHRNSHEQNPRKVACPLVFTVMAFDDSSDSSDGDGQMERSGVGLKSRDSCHPAKKAHQEPPNLGWKVVKVLKNLSEARKYLEESAKVHCHGLPWSQDGKGKGKKQGVTNFCCNFKHSSDCKYKTRILRDLSTNVCTIEETSSVSHADHRIHKTAGHVCAPV